MSSGGEKKQKPAAFAQEKKTFTGEIPKKANEGKGKKSAAYQPRDADTTLDTMSRGRKIQRSIRKQMLLDRMSKSPREQKPERSLKRFYAAGQHFYGGSRRGAG